MHLGLGIAEEFRAGCPKQPDRIIVKPLYSETSYNHHRQTIKRGDTKDQSPEDTLPKNTNLEKLKAVRLRLSFLVHDLRTFKDNLEAENRLDTSTSLHHIGPPYLTDLEAIEALAAPLSAFRALSTNYKPDADDKQSLGTFLDAKMQAVIESRRSKSGEGSAKPDFVLCTSHDLEPMMKNVLGLEWRFASSKEFKRAYEKWTKNIV